MLQTPGPFIDPLLSAEFGPFSLLHSYNPGKLIRPPQNINTIRGKLNDLGLSYVDDSYEESKFVMYSL